MKVTPAILRERERDPLQGMLAFKRIIEADMKLHHEARRFGSHANGVLRWSPETLEREHANLLYSITKVQMLDAEDAMSGHDANGHGGGR